MKQRVKDWIAHHQGKHFCGCGCEQPIVIKRHHHNRGIPKFKVGHMNRGAGNGKWNGGVVVDVRGYRLVYMPDHPRAQQPNGYILEHRLIAERVLGRELSEDEEVHHINEDRSDNRLENLTVLSRRDHRLLHNGHDIKVVPLSEVAT
jgi:hypothetical protein